MTMASVDDGFLYPDTLSIKEVVLLHLRSIEDSDLGVDYWRTQIGISTAVKRRQDQTSQALQALKSEDMISEDKARITGMERKRKVYWLTRAGGEESGRLMRNALVRLVRVKEKNEIINEKLGTFLRQSESPLAISAAINLQISYEQIDVARFKNYVRSLERCGRLGLPRGSVCYIQDTPVLKFFVGRNKELSRIKKWVDSEDRCKVITIHGIPGIGKTTLAAKIARDYEGIYNLYWYRIHPWDTLKNVLNALSPFLMDLGGGKLFNYLESDKPMTLESTVPLLAQDLSDTYTLLFFDDFQRIDPKLIPLFSKLTAKLEEEENIKLIVVGRQILPFYDPSLQREGVVQSMQLEGLDMESSKRMFRQRSIDRDEFLEVYRMTRGHPLFLELIDTGGDYGGYSDIKRYLYEEVLMKLPSNLRDILWRLSVHRYPVKANACTWTARTTAPYPTSWTRR